MWRSSRRGACGGRARLQTSNGDPPQGALLPAEPLLRIPSAMATPNSSAASDDMAALLAAARGCGGAAGGLAGATAAAVSDDMVTLLAA